jgi:hypothetical protein
MFELNSTQVPLSDLAWPGVHPCKFAQVMTYLCCLESITRYDYHMAQLRQCIHAISLPVRVLTLSK